MESLAGTVPKCAAAFASCSLAATRPGRPSPQRVTPRWLYLGRTRVCHLELGSPLCVSCYATVHNDLRARRRQRMPPSAGAEEGGPSSEPFQAIVVSNAEVPTISSLETLWIAPAPERLFLSTRTVSLPYHPSCAPAIRLELMPSTLFWRARKTRPRDGALAPTSSTHGQRSPLPVCCPFLLSSSRQHRTL